MKDDMERRHEDERNHVGVHRRNQPYLNQSLETVNPEDGLVVAVDGSRVTIYNYEWVECINALNGCPDIPIALQEMANNLSCQDLDAYANLIGMNEFCKTRWAGNQNQLVTSNHQLERPPARSNIQWNHHLLHRSGRNVRGLLSPRFRLHLNRLCRLHRYPIVPNH
ncbi:uncharacterized protein LOC128093712 [Culex pipiens pallens]|uniref:uncharacterized protein LOC128093712 n=1 Tax=Culex pipiens pallens TaxID=42434 RepID=UPI0022AB2A82|nr:uncharacterized protein LOC128093712 [Culex pipiens pallens]XP_052567351.1 uncharacterized protein LOC128093712 [Culex pipiens pallens]